MTHQRWTQKTKEFPKSKYGFTEHLKKQGDQLEYYYGPEKDPKAYKKITDAAYEWSHHHRVTIRTRHIRMSDGWGVRVTLAREYRLRKGLMGFNIEDII